MDNSRFQCTWAGRRYFWEVSEEKVWHGIGLIMPYGHAWHSSGFVENHSRFVGEDDTNRKLGIGGKRSSGEKNDVITRMDTIAFFPRFGVNPDMASGDPLKNLPFGNGGKT
jgi:hypothetical protein